jgi:hypothetical protein
MQFSEAYNFLAGGIPVSCADHAGGAWLNSRAKIKGFCEFMSTSKNQICGF